jgi:hypothetical protein
MVGRALFAFIWLLIGVGLLLPAYRAPVTLPAVSRIATDMAAVDVDGALACPPECSCAYLVVAAAGDARLTAHMTVGLLVWPAPQAKPMTSRLPAI